MRKSVIIIGGGIAGLTAGFKLQNAGFDITLLEKSSRIGGVINTIKQDGYLVETGPNTILETSPVVTALVNDCGLQNEKLYADYKSNKRYIVRNNKTIPLPMSPPAFIVSPLFSLFAKLRLVQEPFIKKWDNSFEESLSQFVLRRLGVEFLDYAINPFVAGVSAGDPDNLGVKHGFPKLFALEQKYGSLIGGQIKGARERKRSGETAKHRAKMFSFTKGLKTLPARLGEGLESGIHYNVTVGDITQKKDGFKVVAKDDNNIKVIFSGDIVLYAANAYEMKDITLNAKKNETFSELQDIYFPPVAVLGLGFRKENINHALDGFGVLIPKKERYNILGTLFSSTLFQNRAPDGHALLTVFVGGSRQPENALLPEDKLITMAVADLDKLLGVTSVPEFVYKKIWKKAIPQYEVGYGKYKDGITSLEGQFKGLFFTGNYRGGISVADTIVNSDSVAQRIIDFKYM
jgi:oxygen-dependent protoporphyrinogen oxidase